MNDKYLVNLSELKPWDGDVPKEAGTYAIVILHEKFNVRQGSFKQTTEGTITSPPRQNTETATKTTSQPTYLPTNQPKRPGRPPKQQTVSDIYAQVAGEPDNSNPFEDGLDSIALDQTKEKTPEKSEIKIYAEEVEGVSFSVIEVLGSTYKRQHKTKEKAESAVEKYTSIAEQMSPEKFNEGIGQVEFYKKV